ncbi:M56 family metallopeptidase [Negadavirga shengliensis]|uniref:M56 family metallopeptidase n=1 Tax=Negadavirga shengliensis TaxID=1389218 RepID=A0ABV9T6F9_9BACT
MDTFSTIIPQQLLETIGWTLIHSVWQILLIATLLWGIAKIFRHRKPAFHYRNGLVALCLILSGFLGTLYHLSSTHPSSNEPPTTHEISYAYFSTYQPDRISIYESAREFIITHIELNLPLMVNLWFLGMLFFMVRMAGNLAEIRQLAYKNHKALPITLQKSAVRFTRKLGIHQRIQVMGSEHIQTPMTYGIWKPVVLFPLSLVFQMSPKQLEAILAHELAHIKRCDFGVNLVQSALEVLFFYHPAFWWINGQVRHYREHAADDMAIKAGVDPHALAHGLATVVNHARQNAPELSMAAHRPSFPTLERIQRILGYKKTVNNSNPPLISTAMILACMLSLSLLISANTPAQLSENETWLATTLKNSYTDVSLHASSPQYPLRKGKYAIMRKDTLPKNDVSIDWDTDSWATVDIDTNIFNDISAEWEIANWLPVDFDTNIFIDVQNIVRLDTLPPFPPVPPLVLSPTPVLDFNFDRVFQDSIRIYSKKFGKEYADSIRVITSKIIRIHSDTSPDAELLREKLQSKMEALQRRMNASQEEFAKKMEAWTKEMEPKMKEFEQKMEAWRMENEPKIKEFEEKMEKWAEKHAIQMEKMEQKLKENERKLEQKQKEIENKQKEKDI